MDMKKKIRNFFTLSRKANGGFTLVELIVVIAILAILAGVAVPAYSGYVQKANEAADHQLLAAINTAFAAACIENHVNPADLADGSVSLLPGGKSPIEGVSKYNEEFCAYFQGNLGEKFSVIDVVFANGAFTALSADMQNLLNTLREQYGTQADALLNSTYSEIGYDKLAGQIDNAANLLAGIAASDPDSGFGKLLNNNAAALLEYVGSEEAYEELLAQKKAQLALQYPEITEDDELVKLANAQLLANTSVLVAAKNKDLIDNNFIASLQNGEAVAALKNSVDEKGEASDATVAQAAYAYAMYTSYLQSSGKSVPEEVNILDVYNVLGTDDFQSYMKGEGDYAGMQAKDHAGYMGAMDIISGSANNAGDNTANDILLNGFNNAELVGILQNLAKEAP